MTRNTPSSSNYFDRFPGFLPNPQLLLHEEFERLARFRGWHTGSKQYGREQGRFLRAEFDLHLGRTESSRKLDDWQALCEELRVDSIPKSITKCKKVRIRLESHFIGQWCCAYDLYPEAEAGPCQPGRSDQLPTAAHGSQSIQNTEGTSHIY